MPGRAEPEGRAAVTMRGALCTLGPSSTAFSGPCRRLRSHGRPSDAAAGTAGRSSHTSPSWCLCPGLCTLWGGPGLPRRRRTISPDSRLGSRAAPLSDQWRSSRSPGTRQTGALAQTRTNPQRARRIPVSVDHPPQAHTALPAKTPCTFSFKHQGRSSNTDNYTRAHTRLTLHLHVISNSQESSEKYSCTVTS